MQLWNWKALTVINAHERRVDYQMDCMRRGLELLARPQLRVWFIILFLIFQRQFIYGLTQGAVK